MAEFKQCWDISIFTNDVMTPIVTSYLNWKRNQPMLNRLRKKYKLRKGKGYYRFLKANRLTQ